MTDWTNLPEGHYALPVHISGQHIGYRLFHRATRGSRSTFTFATVAALPGHEHQAAALPAARTYLDSPQRDADVAQLAADPDRWRLLYGTFAGKCGWCGRKLTTKASKAAGIGPDCAASLGWTLTALADRHAVTRP